MELLLNLIWIGLTLSAIFGFLRSRRVSSELARTPYCKSLLALACAAVLLFPIVSASDDLHPAQAVAEEASRRVQRAVASVHGLQNSPPVLMLPVLALYLMAALAISRPWYSLDPPRVPLYGLVAPSTGRAPPSYCWN